MKKSLFILVVAIIASMCAIDASARTYKYTASQSRKLVGFSRSGSPRYSAWKPSSATIEFTDDDVIIKDGRNSETIEITEIQVQEGVYVIIGPNCDYITDLVSADVFRDGPVVVTRDDGEASTQYKLKNASSLKYFFDDDDDDDDDTEYAASRSANPMTELNVVAEASPEDAFALLNSMTQARRAQPAAEEPNTGEVLKSAEQMPTFPGGQPALMKYLSSHINYPTSAQEKGIEGKVIVKFVVRKDGSVGEAQVVRSVDPYLDREAIRVCKSLPRFNPGLQGGQPVNVWYTLPVTFKLSR